MRRLRTLHRYLGAVAALLLLVVAVTGAVLVFKEDIWRLRFTALAAPPAELSAADHARAFAAIDAAYGERIRLVRVPQPGVPAYHVYLRGGEALWRQDGSGPIHEWVWYESPLGVITELHIHLASGNFGKTVLGYLGLAAVFMAVSGVVLWWPVRRQFRARTLWPASFGRAALLRAHRDLGSLAALFIVLFALTASGVIFGQATRSLLSAVFGGHAGTTTVPRVAVDGRVPAPDRTMVANAMAALPAARLMSWSPPLQGSGVHYFRLRQPGEVHPNGRSSVSIDAREGQVLARHDATRDPAGERAANWLYPLHAARWGGWPYRALAVLTALALAFMSLTGIVSFLRGTAKKRHRRDRQEL